MPIAAADWIWMDGSLVPWQDANVHVLTHAFNHGTGVFEGIRCYPTPEGPALFRLGDHVDRLFRSARTILVDVPFERDELLDAAREVVAANGFDACYMRMIAYRAYGEMGINPDLSPVAVAIAAWRQAPSFSPDKYEHGLRVTVSSWRRSDPNVVPPGAKIVGGYVNVALARAEAVRAGFDEAIMLSGDGAVSEGTIENVFVARDGRLATPPLADAVLPGITRATVIELAEELGVECRELSLSRGDLYGADEIFLTGTGVEIVGVREVDGRALGPPGAITRAVSDAYANVVRGGDASRAQWLDRLPQPELSSAPAWRAARPVIADGRTGRARAS